MNTPCLTCGNTAKFKIETDSTRVYCSRECFVNAGLSDVPQDIVLYNIALNLDPASLLALCQTNSDYSQICKNPVFKMEFIKKHPRLLKKELFKNLEQYQHPRMDDEWIDYMFLNNVFTNKEVEWFSFNTTFKDLIIEYYLIKYSLYSFDMYSSLHNKIQRLIRKYAFSTPNVERLEFIFKNRYVANTLLYEATTIREIEYFVKRGNVEYSIMKLFMHTPALNTMIEKYNSLFFKIALKNNISMEELGTLIAKTMKPVTIYDVPKGENQIQKLRLLLDNTTPAIIINIEQLLRNVFVENLNWRVVNLILTHPRAQNVNLTPVIVSVLDMHNPITNMDDVAYSTYNDPSMRDNFMDNLRALLETGRGRYDIDVVIFVLTEYNHYQYTTPEQRELLIQYKTTF